MRVLSLDIGNKSIGIAISSLDKKVIYPYDQLRFFKFNGKDFLISLQSKLKYYWFEIEEVVIGNGLDSEFYNPIVKVIDQVGRILKAKTDWKIVMMSETRSSVESKEILKKLNFSKKKIMKCKDSFAALLILENYFTSINKSVLVGFYRWKF